MDMEKELEDVQYTFDIESVECNGTLEDGHVDIDEDIDVDKDVDEEECFPLPVLEEPVIETLSDPLVKILEEEKVESKLDIVVKGVANKNSNKKKKKKQWINYIL